MITISRKFFQAIKLSPIPAYRLAIRVGLHPNSLSKILHQAISVKPQDPRLLKIGEIIGLKPWEVFEDAA